MVFFARKDNFMKFRSRLVAIVLGRGGENRVGKVPDRVVVLLPGPALPSVFTASGARSTLSPAAIGILCYVNILFRF